MTTTYPKSACEAHSKITTSEPVCVVCLTAEIERLRSALKSIVRAWDTDVQVARAGAIMHHIAREALKEVSRDTDTNIKIREALKILATK